MAGAGHGLVLLWVVALAAFLKCFLNEGIARWQLATDTTAIEGWSSICHGGCGCTLRVYLVIWTVSVSAALTSAAGLGIATLTNGAIPRPWGAVAHSVIGGALVLIGGFKGFENVMKVLIATMFFSIIACAALTFSDPAAVLRGLFVPAIPAGGGSSVLSVLGGIGGSIAMLAYNYWLREEKMVGPKWLRFVRADITIAYAFTAVFGMSIMIVANQAFHVAGRADHERAGGDENGGDARRNHRPDRLLRVFHRVLGGGVRVAARRLAEHSVPFCGLLRSHAEIPARRARSADGGHQHAVSGGTAVHHRVAIPFAFIDQPLIIIRTFTIVGSLFIPFLAATLLYLNNFRIPADSGVPKNSVLTNVVLGVRADPVCDRRRVRGRTPAASEVAAAVGGQTEQEARRPGVC